MSCNGEGTMDELLESREMDCRDCLVWIVQCLGHSWSSIIPLDKTSLNDLSGREVNARDMRHTTHRYTEPKQYR
jgi:hypothetical protein